MIKRGIIPLVLLGFLGAGLLLLAGLGLHWNYTAKKPVQPISFSHHLHIDEVGLDCQHCHQYPAKSPQAGIPAVAVCIDCHEAVAVDRAEIKKLLQYWAERVPIPWNKVHIQPWHVHFTHKRHIKADIECSYCHGDVKVMDTVRQVRSLNMGWCVNCHRENGAPSDCLTCHK